MPTKLDAAVAAIRPLIASEGPTGHAGVRPRLHAPTARSC